MTPFGHAAIGLVVARAHARLVPWLVALGGVLPDVDFVLVWAPQFNAWHRVITHNLAFVAIASLALGWPIAARRRLSVPLTVLAIAIGGVLHLVVDACMDGNSSNGIGIAILWPFDDRMWSPFNVLDAATSGPGWRDPLRALLGSARGLWWELPWIAAAVLLHVRDRRRV